MKNHQEKVCKNWFMRKSGKRWFFGCALLAFGAFLLDGGGVVYADEGKANPALLRSCRLIHQLSRSLKVGKQLLLQVMPIRQKTL